MKKNCIKTMVGILLVSFAFQISACGTLLYPERRGGSAGDIDVKIAVLDGLGLLFGIIPGVVAYIVDFSTGAIYLPSGSKNVVLLQDRDITVIHVSPEQLRNPATVKEIVSREMGLPGVVDWSRLETSRIEPDQIRVRLAEAKAVGFAN
jgi:hypothetical protein